MVSEHVRALSEMCGHHTWVVEMPASPPPATEPPPATAVIETPDDEPDAPKGPVEDVPETPPCPPPAKRAGLAERTGRARARKPSKGVPAWSGRLSAGWQACSDNDDVVSADWKSLVDKDSTSTGGGSSSSSSSGGDDAGVISPKSRALRAPEFSDIRTRVADGVARFGGTVLFGSAHDLGATVDSMTLKLERCLLTEERRWACASMRRMVSQLTGRERPDANKWVLPCGSAIHTGEIVEVDMGVDAGTGNTVEPDYAVFLGYVCRGTHAPMDPHDVPAACADCDVLIMWLYTVDALDELGAPLVPVLLPAFQGSTHVLVNHTQIIGARYLTPACTRQPRCVGTTWAMVGRDPHPHRIPNPSVVDDVMRPLVGANITVYDSPVLYTAMSTPHRGCQCHNCAGSTPSPPAKRARK